MRAIIIKSEERDVFEADVDGKLESLQGIVGGLIDPVYPGLEGTDHHCYVNDEGLLQKPQHFFMFKDGHQPLAGNGVILSDDGEGGEAPATLPLEWVKDRVAFMDLQQVREWAAHEDHAISFFVGEPESDSAADSKDAKQEAASDKDDLKGAREQGQAQYDSIKELVAGLGDEEKADSAREAITQDPLSVLVRGGWHEPGKDAGAPQEFEILLSTGGPAVRLIGTLDDHGEPDSVRLQVQDWFQPWTDFQPQGNDRDAVLMSYAQCFYFGEGDQRTRQTGLDPEFTDAKAEKAAAWARHGEEVERSIASRKDRDQGNER